MNDMTRAVKFGADGLVPAIAQDAESCEVLMVAYMNREALEQTLRSGDAWYWSRSRRRLWRKGEDSGHTQRVREIRMDCDGDALLLVVEQRGPACHTGHRSCFFQDPAGREVAGRPAGDVLDEVFAVIQERAATGAEGSYTAGLLRSGIGAIAAKVAEESAEFIRASREESDQRVTEEAADLVFHSLVLLAARGVGLHDVRRELERRRHGR